MRIKAEGVLPDLSDPRSWHKSSRSSGNGNCVEVARGKGAAAVRDTKDRDGGTLVFTGEAWGDFIAAAKDGQFNLS